MNVSTGVKGMPNKPHVFWDSDVAKWMEAAAFLLEKNLMDSTAAGFRCV